MVSLVASRIGKAVVLALRDGVLGMRVGGSCGTTRDCCNRDWLMKAVPGLEISRRATFSATTIALEQPYRGSSCVTEKKYVRPEAEDGPG